MKISRTSAACLLAIVGAVTCAGAQAAVTYSSSACGGRYSSQSMEWPYTGTKWLAVTSYAMAPHAGGNVATAWAAGYDWWVQATNMNIILPAGTWSYTWGYHQTWDAAFNYSQTWTYGDNCSSAKVGQTGAQAIDQRTHSIEPGISVGSENDAEFAELRANARRTVVDPAVEITRIAAAIRSADTDFAAASAKPVQANMQITPAHIEASELSTARLVGSKEAGVQTAQGWTGLVRLFRSTKNEWFLLEELDVTASGTRLVVFKERINTNVNGSVAALRTLQHEGSAVTTLNFVSGTKHIRLLTNAPAASAGERVLAIARALY